MIPTIDDLKSDKLIHKFGDTFNPPGLTNFIGNVQVNFDLTGIRSLNFPPFGSSDTITAGLFINNRYFPSLGLPISFQWYPDRVERESEYNGIYFKSITFLPFNTTSSIVLLLIENRSGREQKLDIKFSLNSTVTKNLKSWNQPLPPMENDNDFAFDKKRNAILFSALHSQAFSLQGISEKVNDFNVVSLSTKISLKQNEKKTINYVNTIGDSLKNIYKEYDYLQNNYDKILTETTNLWNAELKSAFTPNNNSFSGFMPELNTKDKDILKLYNMGILGVIYFKRDNPYSIYGRAYDTLMPRYWQTVTFIWDYALSSLTHALLDPDVMKKYLQHWMKTDIHKHFGTEYLNGNTVGPWYSVNDFAISTLANDYLRWTGNFNWLNTELKIKSIKNSKNKKVKDFLIDYANHWKKFKTKNGLANYGGINNLLECVSTYINEVAALNSANIFNLRFASEILSLLNNKQRSNKFQNEAKIIFKELQKLYAKGKGFWYARFPENKLIEVRHCYDFITILNTIGDELTNSQKKEIVQFFINELQTPTWMHALSPADNNVIFSVRPDHQWNGAYPAWPAQAVTGLYKINEINLAFNWLKGLAKSANQGPFAQAHFVESAFEPESKGARKSTSDTPFICDWAVSSSGSWTNIIIESIFGVKATLQNGITAEPKFGPFDPKAELINLNYQGKLYSVNKNKIISM